MQIVSEIIDIPNNHEPTTEYIESELKKRGITPLRWAIVKITEKSYTINLACEKG